MDFFLKPPRIELFYEKIRDPSFKAIVQFYPNSQEEWNLVCKLHRGLVIWSKIELSKRENQLKTPILLKIIPKDSTYRHSALNTFANLCTLYYSMTSKCGRKGERIKFETGVYLLICEATDFNFMSNFGIWFLKMLLKVIQYTEYVLFRDGIQFTDSKISKFNTRVIFRLKTFHLFPHSLQCPSYRAQRREA